MASKSWNCSSWSGDVKRWFERGKKGVIEII